MKIVPFGLPSIPGGSQGGYTPQEEPVSVLPFDLDHYTAEITSVQASLSSSKTLAFLTVTFAWNY